MCEQHLSDDERDASPKGAAAFVDELMVAMTNCRIYSAGHPRVESAMQNLVDSFIVLREDSGEERVELGTADGFLFHQRRPLLGATLSARRLIEPLARLNSGGIAFEHETSKEDLHTFVTYLSAGCKGATHFSEANMALAAQGCSTVHLLAQYKSASGTWAESDVEDFATLGPTAEGAEQDEALTLDVPKRLYQDIVSVLQGAMVKSCRGDAIDTRQASGFVTSILTQLAKDTKSMMSLARYEKYDAFTFGHSIRVCFIALNFARRLTDDPVILKRIGLAALMHDIGKSWVPFEVLHSNRRLSNAERREMNLHTVYGGQILLSGHNPDPLSVAVAFSHHQNVDGGGYPVSIRGPRQSTATMIVKLSDVYEALTAVRPYKPRMSPTRAYRIMMSMQGHFEPSLLRRFVSLNGIYPAGSRVRLSSGEIARVEGQTDSLCQPIVTTETASSGETLFEEDVERIDLTRTNGRGPVQIEEMLLEAEM